MVRSLESNSLDVVRGKIALAILALLALLAVILAGYSPAMAQAACHREGDMVRCDDGRTGTFRGEAILWPDGTQSRLAPPSPSVIIGHKDSVEIGQGVFVGNGRGGVVPLKLAKVDPAGDSGRAGGAFSLLFVAPKGSWLPQAIYPVTHPARGAMEIFLVPVGPMQGGNGYQAVFT